MNVDAGVGVSGVGSFDRRPESPESKEAPCQEGFHEDDVEDNLQVTFYFHSFERLECSPPQRQPSAMGGGLENCCVGKRRGVSLTHGHHNQII